jgi:DNA repair protein RadC
MYCIYLDQSLRPTHYALISVGGIDNTLCDLRIVMKHAIDCMATGIILAHNHPSGKMESSDADKKLTRSLRSACDIMHIRFVDHIILSGQNHAFFSMNENGEM